jgi:hypothetical protein
MEKTINPEDTVATHFGLALLKEESNDIKAPERAIPTVKAAIEMYHRFSRDNQDREAQYAAIDGLINGNPPYDPDQLEAQKLNIANVNTLDANSLFKRAAQSYHNLTSSVQSPIKFTVDLPTPEAYIYSRTMSEEFKKIADMWPWFKRHLQITVDQLLKYGHSFVVFSDDKDCKFTSVRIDRVLVSPRAEAELAEIPTVMFETEYTYQELFKIYKDNKNLENSPWDTEVLKDFILNYTNSALAKKSSTIKFSNIYELERQLNTGDLYYDDVSTQAILLVSILQKEYNGKITHYMFYPNKEENNFLYVLDDAYDTLEDGVKLFTLYPGATYLYDVKGIGWKMYPLAEQSVRSTCSFIDLLTWASSIFIKSPTGLTDSDPLRFYQGGVTNIGSAEFAQADIAPNLQAVIAGHQYLQQLLERNLANNGANPANGSDGAEGSITDKQYMFKAHGEYGLLKNDIEHHYTERDRLFVTLVARFLKLPKTSPNYKYLELFKKRCIAKGVPEVLFEYTKADFGELPDYLQIKATRVSGDGSQMKAMASQETLSQFSGGFSAKGQREFLKNVIRTHGGEDEVDLYTQGLDNPDEVSGGASLAAIENALMQDGKQVLFSPDNEHTSHATLHLQFGISIMQALDEEQMDIVQAVQILSPLVSHVEQHLQVLAGNPFTKQTFETLQKAYNELAKALPLLVRNAEAAMKARQEEEQRNAEETQAVMSDEERKDFQAQRHEQRKDFQVQSTVKRADEANRTRANVVQRKTDADIQIKAQKTQAEVAIKQAKELSGD